MLPVVVFARLPFILLWFNVEVELGEVDGLQPGKILPLDALRGFDEAKRARNRLGNPLRTMRYLIPRSLSSCFLPSYDAHPTQILPIAPGISNRHATTYLFDLTVASS